jgi:hypothetical protein
MEGDRDGERGREADREGKETEKEKYRRTSAAISRTTREHSSSSMSLLEPMAHSMSMRTGSLTQHQHLGVATIHPSLGRTRKPAVGREELLGDKLLAARTTRTVPSASMAVRHAAMPCGSPSRIRARQMSVSCDTSPP